ncbi:regulator of G-protein signaling 17 isoform A [Alligator mississippiensis]|uniref:Regulator of G-protein signaling 17 isoform A n=1 Tax=Alligator mississippiensis TaxID=8496 RepID=A0A151NLI0_ALLMI|nr:regulator of G-protein signaling 17 isoform A [Alligator mississippiensis]
MFACFVMGKGDDSGHVDAQTCGTVDVWCEYCDRNVHDVMQGCALDSQLGGWQQPSSARTSCTSLSLGSLRAKRVRPGGAGHLGTEVAEMRKRQQSQNEGTSAVSQAPGNQRPNNTCCFCWCCCCSCSWNEDRGDNAGRPTHTTKMESIQVIEECQNPTADEILSWAQNFDKMMKTPAGRNLFREFLRTEYSEENLLFWLACEDLKKEQNKKVVEEKAKLIYEDYISILSPKEVSLDSRVREVINRNLLDPNPHMYEDAQLQIYTLMHRDSFPRVCNVGGKKAQTN